MAFEVRKRGKADRLGFFRRSRLFFWPTVVLTHSRFSPIHMVSGKSLDWIRLGDGINR